MDGHTWLIGAGLGATWDRIADAGIDVRDVCTGQPPKSMDNGGTDVGPSHIQEACCRASAADAEQGPCGGPAPTGEAGHEAVCESR